MLLQSLVRYYEILAEDPDSGIPLLNYSRANVSYAISLSKEGEIKNIIPLKILDNKGKRYVPISMIVPEQEKKAVKIISNFMCENSSYVLGIDNKGKLERSKECFTAFKDLHLQVLEEVNSDEARAMIKYVSKWNTELACENHVLSKYLEDIIAGVNFVFQLDERPGEYFHNNQVIRDAWAGYKNNNKSVNMRQCLVTGKKSEIARLHASVKGIRGGQPMGNTLVSFNAPAYESYGNEKSQGLNAPVSEYAAFAYASVLTYLLNDKAHKLTLGDATIVFWAESANKGYRDCISMLLEPDKIEDSTAFNSENARDVGAVREIKGIFENIAMGKAVDIKSDTFEEGTKIFILGLSPNAARISLRFFIQDNFGGFVEKVKKHYLDMSIEKQYYNEVNSIPIWRLLNETVSPNSTDKASSPLLSGATLQSILMGTPYPVALYNAIIIRIRAEQMINYYKASIIKAFLIRNYDGYKEVLSMSLNEKCTKKAYLLGRLFAILEKAQEDANPNINTTIKDSYFTSACATPANVFPTLLRLSNHHISKAEYGYVSENRIKTIMDMLEVEEEPFAKNLSLEDQGIFILGYYQQRNNFFKKIDKEN